MVDGAQDYRRFGDADEQGYRNIKLPQESRAIVRILLPDGSPAVNTQVSCRMRRLDERASGHSLPYTDSEGKISLRANPGEVYNIAVESQQGAAPAIWGFDPGDGSEVKNLEIRLRKGTRLHGTVYDSNKKPVPFATIEIQEYGGEGPVIRQTTADKGGKYEYLLPPGSFNVSSSSLIDVQNPGMVSPMPLRNPVTIENGIDEMVMDIKP